MKALRRVPVARSAQLREFRIRVLPFAVFAAALALSVWLWPRSPSQLPGIGLSGQHQVRLAHSAAGQQED